MRIEPQQPILHVLSRIYPEVINVELQAEIECPHCGTKNEVNLLKLTERDAMTCSKCRRSLLESVDAIRVEARDVKTFMKRTQRNIFRNIVLTSGIISVIIIIIFVAASTVFNIPIHSEVILLILGISGAFFAVLLGFFWLLKKALTV